MLILKCALLSRNGLDLHKPYVSNRQDTFFSMEARQCTNSAPLEHVLLLPTCPNRYSAMPYENPFVRE
jgi:hypothetical protein